MSVRAKFRVNSIKQSTFQSGGKKLSTIELSPVYGTSEENKKFFDASPTGKIELGTVNPEAAAQFELDAEYYIDFTKAEVAK